MSVDFTDFNNWLAFSLLRLHVVTNNGVCTVMLQPTRASDVLRVRMGPGELGVPSKTAVDYETAFRQLSDYMEDRAVYLQTTRKQIRIGPYKERKWCVTNTK
jgi:hypothetical protein